VTFGTGTPAYADLPFFMYGGHAAPGWDAADPAAARGLLERAGWKAGPDGIRLRDGVPLRLQYIDYSGSVSGSSIDVQVIQMLRDVGIDVTYKTYAPALYFQPAAQGGALMGGDYDLAAIGISGGNDTTNSAIYGCSSRIPNGFNAANYCSPAMERLQAQALREYDPVKRDRITAQIEDLAVADATYAFLYHTPWRFIANTALQRPVPGLSSPWYDLYRWTLTPPR
jgi:peptide/nickel transport system substrate-binding protein